MKCVVLLFLVAVVAVATAQRNGSKYTTRYDDIDLDEVLKSDRLLNNYFNCLMDRGKCTPEGSELRRTLPDALQTDCVKCSDKQKKGTEKVIRFLVKNKPDLWKQLKTKYDPTGTLTKKYLDRAEKSGIAIPKGV